MRYGKEHKQATRQRIIEAAGRRFKRDGINGSGVATLMKDAGLTNGAFYAHFDSKEDLVAAVVADQLRGECENLGALATGRAGIEQFVRAYLSPEHRDSVEDGCPSAALLDEIARSAAPTRQAYAEGTESFVDDIATRLAPRDPASVRAAVAALFASMVGVLQLARALGDRDLSDAVLEQGIANTLLLLDAAQQR